MKPVKKINYHTMKTLFFVIAILVVGFSANAQNTRTLVNNYTVVKDALTAGDSKGAAQAIAVFQKNVSAEGNFDQKATLLKSADELAKAGTIDKQRVVFNDLSVALWDVIKHAEKLDVTTYYQYCPMKKAYWVSLTKEIKNPYYGAAMLSCGKTVETK